MAIKQSIWCDECGASFTSQEDAAEHGKQNCMPYKPGDRVLFQYALGEHPATVTDLGELVKPGEIRVVYLKSDVQLDPPDMLKLTTGYNFFATLSLLRKLEDAVAA